jgi:SPP1 family predicted phage head-tail adaptor
MRIGPLHQRVTFQRAENVPDGAGGATKAWVDVMTVWAEFVPERARERIRQGRIASAQAGILRIRSSSAARKINDTFRAIVGGVAMNIRSSINPDNRMIEIVVETDGAAG